ncbi:227 kDa spindle- and centromere-associated protein-like [Hydractinia symbiolongicarpus]|uniref:227 kDa spindle- and centromere-associated protein-like n=1 Tax=Hydractinia symbiolongicarpus TaxID=13093 RepID=UPI00254A83E5|nr:227 kDa spindle- and centromere-associated protein-like [Hydractinia symbiolongicarpus]
MDDQEEGQSDHEELTKLLRGTFQDKLMKLSRQNSQDDPKFKEQLRTLQKYVSELSEQNEMLVQTIEELENDSNDKIASLENKLVNTELFLKEQTKRCDHLQCKIDTYEEQKKDIHKHVLVLEEEATSLGEENLRYQSHISNLESDLDELVGLIKKARIEGKWELSKLNLKVIPAEDLLDEKTIVDPLPRKDTELLTDKHVDELKMQLIARDRTISMLEKELKEKTEQYHAIIDEVSHTGEVVDSVKSDMYQLEKQQRNNSSLMSHKDFLIQRLKNQLKSFEEAEHHLEEEMNKKQHLIDSLQEDNNSLKNAMELRIIELKNKTQSIEILERHLNELKEKVLNDSLKDISSNSNTHLQLQDANSKIDELHEFVCELKLTKETDSNRIIELTHEVTNLNNMIDSLNEELDISTKECAKHSSTVRQLSDQLQMEKKKVSGLELKLDSRLNEAEISLKKDIERKDREIRLLQGNLQRLETQRDDVEAKVTLRDKAIERLQHQQKEYMDEVTRRDSALHSLELKLLQVEDEKRRGIDETERISKNYSLASKDLKTVKEQHSQAMTQVGKLEAKIKAYEISNESESSILTGEVAKREELIRQLKQKNLMLEEKQKDADERVENNMKLMEENETQQKDLKEKLHGKEKMIIDLEAVIAELRNKDEVHKNKIEEYEDEAREIILKLNAAERAQEQEAHKLLLTEEQLQELALEMEKLHSDHQKLLQQISSKDSMVEQLTNDVLHYKQKLQEKDNQNQKQQEALKNVEQEGLQLRKELEELQRENSDDLSSKDRKIAMLEDQVEISHQRYADVNDELTATELQCESINKKYREIASNAEHLQIQLQESKEEIQELEMNLAVTSEKHQTSIKENALKDKNILNLQSELDATQQEFEHAVEELAQKSEELDNLHENMRHLTKRCHLLECERDDSAKKTEENVDLINHMQMKNAELMKELKHHNEELDNLNREITSLQEKHGDKENELQLKISSLEVTIAELEENNKKLRDRATIADEKNAELLSLKNEEADGKQTAMFKYEDLRETFEEHKMQSESEIQNLNDKVNTLKNELHSSTLKVSQLDGNLRLTAEKLKNTENQLFEAERSAVSSDSTIEELRTKVKEQDEIITKKVCVIDELEKSCCDYSVQIKTHAENATILKNELTSTAESLDDAKLRNTRCEEIIREMRDKLSSKLRDYDNQNEVLSRLQVEHKTLQETHLRVCEDLSSFEALNRNYTEELNALRGELDQRQMEYEDAENEKQDLARKLDLVNEEKTKAHEKIVQLDKKFSSLKTSLERDNFSLIEENSVLKQNLNEKSKLVSMLEQKSQAKSEENKLLEDKMFCLNDDIKRKMNELEEVKEEFYNAEQTVNELHLQLQHVLEDKKRLMQETSQQLGEINQLRSNFTEKRQQYKDTAQQLAHYQEKVSLTERNLSATQDQLSSKIAENVRLEKVVRKTQSDYKRLSDDRKNKELQIAQCNQLLEETRADVESSKQKCQTLMEENKAQSAALTTYESQLDESHNQTEQLSIQIESQQNAMKQTESALFELQGNFDKIQQQFSDQSEELANEKTKLSLMMKREQELSTKQREGESNNNRLHFELENAMQKNKSCLEQIASKDGELRVLKADLHSQQKKCSHQEKQINRSNDQISRLQKEVKELKTSSEKTLESLTGHEYESEKLRNELLSAQSNQKEYYEQLAQKSKELATVKSELQTARQNQFQIEQQYSIIDSKSKKLKSELKKSLERNKSSATEMANLTREVGELKSQLQHSFEQQRQQNDELTKRDEKIITLKVDVAAVEERLKLKEEEVDRLKNESLRLNQQHHKTLEQLHETKQELESVKINGDRLTRESEMVVENMNTWVKEQRHGNDRIASKMSKQNERINQLESSNRQLKGENDRLRQDTEKFKHSLDGKKSELERLKKQTSHSAHNQAVTQQLKTRVKELEDAVDKEKREKENNVNELRDRLKTNVETIQQLHKQLSELNKENIRQRALLDRQSLSRKSLHAQLKSKENDIELLREDLNKSLQERNLAVEVKPRRMPPLAKPDNISALLNQELERAGASSEDALDKSYWINRVGELSVQLQQSSDYWTRKLNAFTYENT